MRLKHSIKGSGGVRQLSLPRALGEPYDLLPALFQSSTVGVAICDRQLRFRAINHALASMNGLPAAAHLGKAIQAVLGNAAAKVLHALEQVLATGQPLTNIELKAKLPTRDAPGHWNASYFPIKNRAGEVQHVGAIVLELTKGKELDSALLRLSNKLMRILSAWRHDSSSGDGSNVGNDSTSLAGDFARSVTLLESCLSETRAISNLLRVSPHITASQPLDVHLVADEGLLSAGEGLDFVRAGAAEPVGPLSAREREIAAHLADGKSNKQIGSMLAISTRTVESHRARIMLKLDLHSVTDLVRYAVRSNLIQP
jgi:DNA-binding CsgD family transcriptional regulator